jgi:hypothetical protein
MAVGALTLSTAHREHFSDILECRLTNVLKLLPRLDTRVIAGKRMAKRHGLRSGIGATVSALIAALNQTARSATSPWCNMTLPAQSIIHVASLFVPRPPHHNYSHVVTASSDHRRRIPLVSLTD